MQSHNPVLNRAFDRPRSTYQTPAPSAEQLEQMYQAPPAGPLQTGRMTYDDVVTRGGMMFAVLLVGAVIGWQLPGLALVGFVAGLVLALVNIFKREPSPALILAYAGFQGLFLGGISVILESYTPSSIVPQAVLGTMGVFAVSLWAYKSGRIRVTPKFQRGVLIALGGYLIFVVFNLIAQWANWTDGPFGFRQGSLGIVIGLFAIGLAALVLVLDFDFIEKGVQAGIPNKYAWTAAFGLTVTLVWLYIEMLRLLAILQGE